MTSEAPRIPEDIRREYEDDARWSVRNAALDSATGPDPRALVVECLAELGPGRRVLEVGSGRGELAERIAEELDLELVASDQSAGMVELTRARGVEAVVADV